MSETIWIRTDQEVEVLKALEMFYSQLGQTEKDLYCWKWDIIALHNALQASIVRAIRGMDNLGALKPKIAEKWRQVWHSEGDDYPELRLDWFPNLYARMKEQFDYKPKSGVDESVTRLNNLRNQFIHFSVSGWVIDARILPPMAQDCMDVIMYLAREQIDWYELGIADHIDALDTTIGDLLTRFKMEYDS